MKNGLREFIRRLWLSEPVFNYRGVEVSRCRTDDQLVSKGSFQHHAGHFVRSPVVLTWKEKFLIWVGIIS